MKTWKNDPVFLQEYIQDEIAELTEAITEGADPIHIGGEIGDVLSLLIKYKAVTGITSVQLPKDLQSGLELALSTCRSMHLHPMACILMKLDRNELKYPAEICSNGYSSEEAHLICKQAYEVLGGDETFFGRWAADHSLSVHPPQKYYQSLRSQLFESQPLDPTSTNLDYHTRDNNS